MLTPPLVALSALFPSTRYPPARMTSGPPLTITWLSIPSSLIVQPLMSMSLPVGLYSSNHSPAESETASGFWMISLITTSTTGADAVVTRSRACRGRPRQKVSGGAPIRSDVVVQRGIDQGHRSAGGIGELSTTIILDPVDLSQGCCQARLPHRHH